EAPAASPASPLVFQVCARPLPDLAMQARGASRELLRLGHHDDAIALAEHQQLIADFKAERFAGRKWGARVFTRARPQPACRDRLLWSSPISSSVSAMPRAPP